MFTGVRPIAASQLARPMEGVNKCTTVFLVEDINGNVFYTLSFKLLFFDEIVNIIKHERTFDDGATWKLLD